jgi:hypothetical protein
LRSGNSITTGTIRLGIYNHDASTGKPSTVALDAGTVSTTAINTVYQITINQTLAAGWYWLALNAIALGNLGSAQITAITAGNNNSEIAMGGASGIGVNTNLQVGWTESVDVTSGFPTAGTVAYSSAPYLVWLRVA